MVMIDYKNQNLNNPAISFNSVLCYFISFSCVTGCCGTVKVTTKNNAHIYQHIRDGIYNIHGQINERSYWLSFDKKMAMWQFGNSYSKRWCIAKKEHLGTGKCGLISDYFTGAQCPDDLIWRYLGKNGVWYRTTDVQIKCFEKGMLM